MNDSPAPVRIKTRPTPAHRSGKPPRIYLCMLYADDCNAGKIIDFVASWYPHAQRRRKGTQGVWSVFSRQELREGAGLTPKQYRNAMPVAVGCGAVDFVIGGHQGKKGHLHPPDSRADDVPPGRHGPPVGRETSAQRARSRARWRARSNTAFPFRSVCSERGRPKFPFREGREGRRTGFRRSSRDTHPQTGWNRNLHRLGKLHRARLGRTTCCRGSGR